MFQKTADKASAGLYSLQFQKIVMTMKQEPAEIRKEFTTCVIPEKNRLISNYLSILFGVLCLLSGQALVCS